MNLDNDNIPINKIIRKINEAAKKNEALYLTADEVKIVSEDFGDQYFVPILTNEQLIKLCDEGKLGKPIFKKEKD